MLGRIRGEEQPMQSIYARKPGGITLRDAEFACELTLRCKVRTGMWFPLISTSTMQPFFYLAIVL